MHSRIYQLNELGQELKCELINENTDFDLFASFADYVADSDLKNDFEWIKHCYKDNFKFEEKDGKLLITFTEKGIRDILDENLQKAKDLLNDMTIEDFANYYSSDTYKLKELLSGDDFGFHFMDTTKTDNLYCGYLENMLGFLKIVYRYLKEKELEEITYEIISSLDYHN